MTDRMRTLTHRYLIVQGFDGSLETVVLHMLRHFLEGDELASAEREVRAVLGLRRVELREVAAGVLAENVSEDDIAQFLAWAESSAAARFRDRQAAIMQETSRRAEPIVTAALAEVQGRSLKA